MCPAIVIIISRIYYLAESIYTSSTLLTSGMISPPAPQSSSFMIAGRETSRTLQSAVMPG